MRQTSILQKRRSISKKLENVLDAKARNAVPDASAIRTAEVIRQDEDGTWWVSILGGAMETPLNGGLGYEIEKGDYVQVEIDEGVCRVVTNTDYPAVSVRGARTVSQTVIQEALEPNGDIRKIIEEGERISRRAESDLAKNLADTVKAIAEASGITFSAEKDLSANIERTKEGFKSMARGLYASGQHFWNDDEGFHVSDGSKDPLGDHNLLGNSYGIFLRNQDKVRVGIVDEGVFVGNGTVDALGTWTPVTGYGYASYLQSGVTIFDDNNDALGTFAGGSAIIGKSTGYHVAIASSGNSAGIVLLNNTTQLGSFTPSGVIIGNPVSGSGMGYSSFTSGGVTIYDESHKALGTFAGGSATIGPSISNNEGWKLILGSSGVAFHYTSNNGVSWQQAGVITMDSAGNLGLQSGSVLLNNLRITDSGIEYIPKGYKMTIGDYYGEPSIKVTGEDRNNTPVTMYWYPHAGKITDLGNSALNGFEGFSVLAKFDDGTNNFRTFGISLATNLLHIFCQDMKHDTYYSHDIALT